MGSQDAPQKMQFLGAINKSGKSGPMAPKYKMAENLHRIDCRRPKIGLDPNFPGYSNSP